MVATFRNVPLSRGEDFWTPEPLFAGATVFCIGGGPSLRGFDLSRLDGLRCIAVNEASKHKKDAEVLYFTDNGWWEQNKEFILSWPGLAVTSSRAAKAAAPRKLLRIRGEARPDFPVGQPVVKRGRTSGHTAVSLAIAMGAKRVVLLGYDCRLVDGRSHWHDAYRQVSARLYSDDFLPAWNGWGEAARAAGVDVVNATPGSALREFPFVDIEDEIAEARAQANRSHAG